MAANIPGAVQGTPHRPLEQALLALASQAPSALMGFLDLHQRQVAAAQAQQMTQMQGSADLAALGGAVQGGTITDPGAMAAIQQAGGSYRPAQAPMQGTAVGGNAPVNIQRPAAVNTSGIDPRMGTSLLNSVMGIQQGAANIKLTGAQTAASIGNEKRASDLAGPQLDLAKTDAAAADLKYKLDQQFSAKERQSGLDVQGAQVRASNASARASDASIVDQAAGRVQSVYDNRMQTRNNLMATYGQIFQDANLASARANADVFGSPEAPSFEQFSAKATPRMFASMLHGGDGLSAVFDHLDAAEPTMAYGKRIGFQPEEVTHITQQLELGKQGAIAGGVAGSAKRIFTQIDHDMRKAGVAAGLSKAEVDTEVGVAQAQTALLISFITGEKLAVPDAAKAPTTGARLREILMTTMGAIGSPQMDRGMLTTPPKPGPSAATRQLISNQRGQK